LDKEWKLAGVGDFINSDLLPLKIAAIWTCAVTFDCAAAKLLFNLCPKVFALLLGDLVGRQLRCTGRFEEAV
jgi:hypothetical protein